jgi:hypothetical protein
VKRVVQPELLDTLPPDEPRAIRSRRDLRRVNAWMRNHAIMARALESAANGHAPRRILDLGAGDGEFLLRVARRLSSSWKNVEATLLDRRTLMKSQTFTALAGLGWHAEMVGGDVFEWVRSPSTRPAEVVIANLFLHHFSDARLAELLRGIDGRVRLFVAVEPRRGGWPLLCSRMLWAIGCSGVTRYDAVASVRAGFARSELSAFWPAGRDWQVTELPAGLFSHLFVAQRIS